MRVMIDVLSKGWVRDAAIGIAASLLLGACSLFSFPLPFTPVPVSVQVQVVLFLAALMGARRGVWMVSSFITQGVMGLPVFAGGASTLAVVMGPRGGYLAGYLVAAYVVGKLCQRYNLFLSMCVGNVIVYVCGLAWLSQFLGMQKALFLGVAPFVIADLVKIALFTSAKTMYSALRLYFSK